MIVFILVMIFKSTPFSASDWRAIWINFVIPLFFFGVFLFYYYYYRQIEKKLYPQIMLRQELIRPEELNFHINYDIIDPFALYDNIP